MKYVEFKSEVLAKCDGKTIHRVSGLLSPVACIVNNPKSTVLYAIEAIEEINKELHSTFSLVRPYYCPECCSLAYGNRVKNETKNEQLIKCSKCGKISVFIVLLTVKGCTINRVKYSKIK
ncbi:MAG: hypothetical protein HGB12_00165 [Bacteroidetes bacterium]|nr:hypothetical protein [Bacteroidota bacterium]